MVKHQLLQKTCKNIKADDRSNHFKKRKKKNKSSISQLHCLSNGMTNLMPVIGTATSAQIVILKPVLQQGPICSSKCTESNLVQVQNNLSIKQLTAQHKSNDTKQSIMIFVMERSNGKRWQGSIKFQPKTEWNDKIAEKQRQDDDKINLVNKVMILIGLTI